MLRTSATVCTQTPEITSATAPRDCNRRKPCFDKINVEKRFTTFLVDGFVFRHKYAWKSPPQRYMDHVFIDVTNHKMCSTLCLIKKLCVFLFSQDFFKFPPILITFGSVAGIPSRQPSWPEATVRYAPVVPERVFLCVFQQDGAAPQRIEIFTLTWTYVRDHIWLIVWNS